MRLLGGLGLLAPFALLVVLGSPCPRRSTRGPTTAPSIVVAVVAGGDRRLADRRSSSGSTSGSGFGGSSGRPSGSPRASSTSRRPDRGGGLEGRLGRGDQRASAVAHRRDDRRGDDRQADRRRNRQTLLATLFAEVERANRYERPLSVAFVDIDHFKTVNDTYGHAAGDIVLRGVAQTIKDNLRATDLIGRYGGEEFMLLLTETDVEDGAILAEKLRNLVARQRFTRRGQPELSVTISIGIAGGQGAALRIDALARDADAAMYSAKSLGRNQTYVFAEPDEDARIPRAPISPAGRALAHQVGRIAREAATAA